MTLKYNRFGYLIGEGFANVFKNKKSTGASLMIMCATMIIFGIFLALGENINHFVQKIESDQGVQVFINKEASDEQIQEVGRKIRQIQGVQDTVYKSKDDALTQMRDMLKDKKELLEGYEENNIFPASYVVTFTDLTMSSQIQDQISKIENVDSITSSDKTIETLIKLANGVKIVTGVILVLLVIISIFIISNTIKLTVHARRREISIMKYVGATNNFIRWPFIVEGMIIGVFASAISIVLVGGLYTWVAQSVANADFIQRMNINLVTFAEMFNSIILVYVLLGIGIGALGSIISMRKYLKV